METTFMILPTDAITNLGRYIEKHNRSTVKFWLRKRKKEPSAKAKGSLNGVSQNYFVHIFVEEF